MTQPLCVNCSNKRSKNTLLRSSFSECFLPCIPAHVPGCCVVRDVSPRDVWRWRSAVRIRTEKFTTTRIRIQVSTTDNLTTLTQPNSTRGPGGPGTSGPHGTFESKKVTEYRASSPLKMWVTQQGPFCGRSWLLEGVSSLPSLWESRKLQSTSH